MEESESKKFPFIREFYNDSHLIKRLEFCHAIVTTLEPKALKSIMKLMKEPKDMKAYIEVLMKNPTFMREIQHRYSLSNSAENVLYFGKDFGLQDTYKFLSKTEEKISEINLVLLNFVNIVLKELKLEENVNLNY